MGSWSCSQTINTYFLWKTSSFFLQTFPIFCEHHLPRWSFRCNKPLIFAISFKIGKYLSVLKKKTVILKFYQMCEFYKSRREERLGKGRGVLFPPREHLLTGRWYCFCAFFSTIPTLNSTFGLFIWHSNTNAVISLGTSGELKGGILYH